MTEEKSQIEEIEEEQAKKAKEKKQETEEEIVEEESEDEEKTEKKKSNKKERTGILYINTTKNNTILSVSDLAGNTIARASGGQSTKQSRLKASPTIAMFGAKKLGEEIKEHNITNLYVRVKAETGSTTTGSASYAIIKTLSRDGFKIINIMETTKQPRGGPKAKGGRRGRRV